MSGPDKSDWRYWQAVHALAAFSDAVVNLHNAGRLTPSSDFYPQGKQALRYAARLIKQMDDDAPTPSPSDPPHDPQPTVEKS